MANSSYAYGDFSIYSKDKQNIKDFLFVHDAITQYRWYSTVIDNTPTIYEMEEYAKGGNKSIEELYELFMTNKYCTDKIEDYTDRTEDGRFCFSSSFTGEGRGTYHNNVENIVDWYEIDIEDFEKTTKTHFVGKLWEKLKASDLQILVEYTDYEPGFEVLEQQTISVELKSGTVKQLSYTEYEYNRKNLLELDVEDTYFAFDWTRESLEFMIDDILKYGLDSCFRENVWLYKTLQSHRNEFIEITEPLIVNNLKCVIDYERYDDLISEIIQSNRSKYKKILPKFLNVKYGISKYLVSDVKLKNSKGGYTEDTRKVNIKLRPNYSIQLVEDVKSMRIDGKIKPYVIYIKDILFNGKPIENEELKRTIISCTGYNSQKLIKRGKASEYVLNTIIRIYKAWR